MKVLVTGGAGYVGSHCCKALALAGHEPIVFDNLSTGHAWAVQWGPLEQGDILDEARLSEVIAKHRPEGVIHFAALAYVGESVQKPDLYYRTNVGGLINILKVIRANDISRIVFSSTCATYGTPKTVPITKIAALRLMQERAADSVRFLFIGGGAKQDDLRDAASELPYGFVSFRPYQPMEKLAESLSVPDIHWISLQPELEGLIVPSKLYGALAVGRPIVFIGHANAEVARLVAEADCGASFVPGEAEKLTDYLAKLAADPGLRRKLGGNARAYLEQELRRTSRIEEWHDLIGSFAET